MHNASLFRCCHSPQSLRSFSQVLGSRRNTRFCSRYFWRWTPKITQTFQAYSRPDPPLSEGWKGYVIMAHAIIDPEAAWAEAQQLTGYDDGNTKSNTLYWIGTRPGSNDCPDCTTRPPQPTDHPTDKPTTHPPVDGCDCHPGGTTIDPRCKKRKSNSNYCPNIH